MFQILMLSICLLSTIEILSMQPTPQEKNQQKLPKQIAQSAFVISTIQHRIKLSSLQDISPTKKAKNSAFIKDLTYYQNIIRRIKPRSIKEDKRLDKIYGALLIIERSIEQYNQHQQN